MKVNLRLSCLQHKEKKRMGDKLHWCVLGNVKCPYMRSFSDDHRITPIGIEYCDFGIQTYFKKAYK